MRQILCLGLLTTFAQLAVAQQFGGNPPSLKWQQVNTDTVRVIFPAGMSAEGRRVADIIHHISKYNHASIGDNVKKVSIVLQNQTLQANGYVQLGPFRSEFFMTPPANSNDVGALNWTDQLALHEYRHVLQNSNFRKGLSKVFYYLGGELSQAAITNIAVPDWFWEGDAVVTETALSNQGRGRLPAFFEDYRALTLADKRYTFMQLRNGSFKNYIPTHYPTGYLMTSYGRRQFGQNFWKDVTDDAVRYKGLFYPFSQSLKRRTGMNAAAFFKASLADYQKQWELGTAQSADTLTPVTSTVTNYKYVYTLENGNLIVSKRSFKKITAFYEKDAQGKETKIATPGVGFDDYFSYRNGHLLWTEARFDVRWGWRDYSIVKIYDRNNGKMRTLKQERRSFSPDLSFDGNKVVVFTTTPEQKYALKILDAHSGASIKDLPNPENWYYTYPKFTKDDQYIISAVRDQVGKMALVQQSVQDGSVKILVPFGLNTLGIPSIHGDTVYFTAGFTDVMNVFTYADGRIKQVTDRPNGVQHMAVMNDQIVYSEFTADGYKLLRTPIHSRPINLDENHHDKWLQPDFGEKNILTDITPRDYDIRKYSKAHRIFNFHSWLPEINDPEYGLFAYGENVLGTLQSTVGYYYNTNEQSHGIGAELMYGAWFPYVRAGGDYRMQRYFRANDTTTVIWNELDWHGGLYIPLNFSGGKYYRNLAVNGDFHHLMRFRAANSKYRFRDDNIQYIDLGLTFTNQLLKAQQHIFPRFAQSLQLRYNKSINNVPAEQFYGRFDLYLPGLAANHSLVLQGAFQKRDTMQRYLYSDNFVYPRGYNSLRHQTMFKLGANYHFPIAYPDWGFANLLFFNRIRGNIFYDYSEGWNYQWVRHEVYASTGAEVFFDTKLGNALPFSFGMRFSHLLNDDVLSPGRGQRFEFIVPLQQLFNY